jgi:hypothetical protein
MEVWSSGHFGQTNRTDKNVSNSAEAEFGTHSLGVDAEGTERFAGGVGLEGARFQGDDTGDTPVEAG